MSKKSSKEQKLFAETALEVFAQTFSEFRFKKYKVEIEQYSTFITFRKDNQYIKISASTYPRDYPYSYNVILGEGDCDDFWEYDWNSVALWRIKAKIDPKSRAQEFEFPFDESRRSNLEIANQELRKYGLEFLNGNLELFIEVRKEQTKGREPYKIHSADEKGNYKTTDEPKSVEQKKKYS